MKTIFNVYLALTNPYMRVVRPSDGSIVAAADWSLSKTTSWANSAITLTSDAVIGAVPIKISTDLPAGDYDVLVYDAANPANTDDVETRRRIQWSGSNLIGSPYSV